ncbi:LPS export ABC transporter periplasmic protein LptC [Flavobacterium cyanobacteriorum]|uniref:LPS export ABC transporter periplasmic protein LptC n=1 Tax=Flavobacterium cyanobacteriorum TaxID=2022802 RepID=A0A255YYX6_9FLAO|nr:LPS export ABC transporter periplasmic protein LptC [Flavobacterium cyanobacteriorum]OYQ34389.1 LPS export ABC transporter periplasmic protein LptC [Flavobacterium cyanobacteriorum]
MKQLLRLICNAARGIAGFVLLLFAVSCDRSFKDVQRINSVAFSPAAQAEDINLKYTDSGKVKATLLSPLMLDFSNLEYGFNEFPKGVNVTLYGENNQQTNVVADYAITYANTDIIDLQGNVKITTGDGKVLTTEQLYYDQKNEWFYTEKRFKFTSEDGSTFEGPGLDFSKDFRIMNTQRNTGEINKIE